jgi:hypothetical protein
MGQETALRMQLHELWKIFHLLDDPKTPLLIDHIIVKA